MLVRVSSAILSAAIVLSAGCETEVALETTIPDPVVEALPLTVGVYYEPEFSNYIYSEKASGKDWKIDLGSNTITMMERVLARSFTGVVRLDALPAEGAPQPGVDFLLKP